MTTGEHTHNPLDPHEAAARSNVLALLSEQPLYAPDAPIVSYLTSRVAVLAGDEYPMPHVIVRDSPEANACVLSGYMVIDSGLLDILDFEEEIDAVIGHEMTHLNEGHTHDERPDGFLEGIGQTRSHEVEADLGSMTLLDRRGINPRGAISAFAKLGAATSGKAHLTASPTHGQSSERAVNIDQSFFLYDARSLSDAPLTPLQIRDKADRGHVVERFDDPVVESDALIGQAVMARHMRTFDPAKDDPTILIGQQAKLLESKNPSLDHDEAMRLSRLIAFKYRAVVTDHTIGVGVERAVLASSSMPSGATAADAEQLAIDLEHPAIVQQCGSFSDNDRFFAAATLASSALRGNALETGEMTTVAETLKGITGSHRFLVTGMRAALRRRGGDQDFIDRAAKLLGPTNIPIETFEHPDQRMLFRLRRRMAQIRVEEYERLRASGDTITLLRYIADSKSSTHGVNYNAAGDDDDEDTFDSDLPEYGAYSWHAYAEKGELGRDTEGGYVTPDAHLANSPIWNYVANLTDRKGLRKVLRTLAAKRDEIGDADTVAIADLLISEERYASNNSSNTGENLGRHMELIPAYAMAGKKGDLKALLEASLVRFATAREAGKSAGVGLVGLLAELDVELQILDDEPDETAKGRRARLRRIGTNRPNDHYRLITDQWEEMISKLIEGIDGGEFFQEALDAGASDSAVIRDYRLLAALEQLRHDGGAEKLLNLLEGGSLNRIRGGGAFVEEPRLTAARTFWEASTVAMLADPNLLSDDQHLLTLAALGMCAESIEVNLQIPAEAMRLLIQRHTFDEGMELVFATFDHLPLYVMHGAVDELIESKARSLADFAKLDTYMQRYVSRFADDQQASIGLGSIIETNLIDAYKTFRTRERRTGIRHDTVAGLESARLMQALLSTVENDEAIRQYVFERWWVANRTSAVAPDLEGYFKVEDIAVWRYPGKEARLEYWINELPEPGKYTPVEEALNNLYLSNNAARYLAVRKILLGEGGVLADADGRQGLVEGLMGSWLKYEEGSTAQQILHNLLSSLMSSAQSEELYKMVGPILQELILRPPREPAANSAIARTQAERIIANMHQQKHLRAPTEADIENVHKKILNLMRGSVDPPKERSSATNDLLSLFGDPEAYEFSRISPTELALMAGKKSGSLGVRMLQLAGQYYDIPEEERDAYNEVYDSIKGQTRIQAYRVLMREAQYSAEMAAFVDQIESIEERLGGGSLVTVYGVKLRDGSDEIIGVRNPNAQYHVGNLATILTRALDIAIDRDPNNIDLHIARSLVQDAVTWIRDELNDTHFTAKDTVFRDENDTLIGNGFKKGRSRYDVYVPTAPVTGSDWIRRETRVEGQNLGSLTISDDEPTSLADKRISRDDYKDAVSTLTRGLLHQIRTGSVVHSDIHPGNFRITSDNNRLAVFDRYNLIPVTPELRDTLQQTFQAGFSGNMHAAVESIVRFAAVGQDVDIPSVTTQVASALTQEQDLTVGMVQTIIELKKTGVVIPVHLSLLLRNIFVMSRMAQRAGFENLVQAFVHTADEDEITATLAFFAEP